MASDQPRMVLTALFLSLFLLPLCNCACDPRDRSALLQINQQMNNTFGFATANASSDCCLWYIVDCDAAGRVTSLAMTNQLLTREYSGQLPAAIAQLTELQSLTVWDLPSINGPLPDAFVNLKQLANLDIRRTGIWGPIPNWIGRLGRLTLLNLRNNQFSGQIPGSLANLADIVTLTISGHPMVTGPIPDSFGRFVGNFPAILSLFDNGLSGSIPKSFATARLRTLELQNNQLVGDLSALFKNQTGSLESIDVSSNRLQFDLSGVVFPGSLSSINLAHNRIYGSIPTQVAQLTGLKQFNVSYNRLCGKIPVGGPMSRIPKSSYEQNLCLCGRPLPNKCK